MSRKNNSSIFSYIKSRLGLYIFVTNVIAYKFDIKNQYYKKYQIILWKLYLFEHYGIVEISKNKTSEYEHLLVFEKIVDILKVSKLVNY